MYLLLLGHTPVQEVGRVGQRNSCVRLDWLLTAGSVHSRILK